MLTFVARSISINFTRNNINNANKDIFSLILALLTLNFQKPVITEIVPDSNFRKHNVIC